MSTLKRLLGYLKKHWFFLLLALLSLTVNRVLTMAVPEISQRAIDIAIAEHRHGLLAVLALAIVGVTILRGVFHFGQEYTLQYAAQRAIYDIRNTMYDHLQRLPFSFYDKSQTGQLIARATGDIDSLRRFFSFGLLNFISSVFIFVAVLVVCLLKNWKLAIIGLSVMPAIAYSGTSFGKKIGPRFRTLRQKFADVTTAIQENVTGARVVRTFAREDHETDKFSTQVFYLRIWEHTRIGFWRLADYEGTAYSGRVYRLQHVSDDAYDACEDVRIHNKHLSGGYGFRTAHLRDSGHGIGGGGIAGRKAAATYPGAHQV
jgi:ATP-binding cassette subfamily B multidrug efflux pump